MTYNGGNGEVVLLSVLEETEDIVTDDDAGLAGKNLKSTHVDYVKCTEFVKFGNWREGGRREVRKGYK